MVDTPASYWPHVRVEVTWASGGRSFSRCFDAPFIRIGDSESADVVLDFQSEPERVYLHITDEGIYFIRLASIDSPQTTATGWLKDDEILIVGGWNITASAPKADAPQFSGKEDLLQYSPSSRNVPEFEIRHREATKIVRRHVRRALTIVGRTQLCRIRHPSVSLFHAIFYWRHERLWAVNLAESGTRINGAFADAEELSPGDTLEMGQVTMMYVGVVPNTTSRSQPLVLPDQIVEDASGNRRNGGVKICGPESTTALELQLQNLLSRIDSNARRATAADPASGQAHSQLLAENLLLKATVRELAAGCASGQNVLTLLEEWNLRKDFPAIEYSDAEKRFPLPKSVNSSPFEVEIAPAKIAKDLAPQPSSLLERPLGQLLLKQTSGMRRRRRRILAAGVVGIIVLFVAIVIFHEPLVRWARAPFSQF